METPARSLTSWLRARGDDDLRALVSARPELLQPLPADMAALAARATTRGSVLAALEQLDTVTLRVLDGLVVLKEPATIDGLLRALGAESDAAAVTVVTDAVERLRRLALAWGDIDALHVVAAVRDLSPYPGGLGPPLEVTLTTVPIERLFAIARDLGLADAGADGFTLRGSIAEHLSEPTALAALVATAPTDARRVLDLLAWDSPTGQVEQARRWVDASSADTPVRWLIAHALLMPLDDTTVVLPREIGLHLRGGKLFRAGELTAGAPPLGGPAHDAGAIDAVAAAAAFTVVRAVEALLESWAAAPPRVLRAGGLGVRELRRTARELDVEESVAALLAEVAAAAGLLAPDGEFEEAWAPTPAYDSWRASPTPRRWQVLASAWLGMVRVPGLVTLADAGNDGERPPNALSPDVARALAPVARRAALDLLAALPAGQAPPAADVVERAAWCWPRRGGRLRDLITAWTLEEAETVGVLGRGALTTHGRALLDGNPNAAEAALEPRLPRPLDHVLLQADLTAVAPGPLESGLARELALTADIESTGGATVYRFTQTSVRRALDAGRTAADLHDLLNRHSRTPVPQPLGYLIDDVARRHGRLRVGAAGAYVRCDDPAVVKELLSDRRAEGLGLRSLAPGVVASPLAPDRLLERLRELGYTPAAEAADGTLVVRRPDAHRAPPRPVNTQPLGGSRTPRVAVTLAAVQAIRAGDAAAQARANRALPQSASPSEAGAPEPSGGLTRSTPAVTLHVLREAAAGGWPVWIGYVNAQGQASNRIVEPESLTGGYLHAYDHRRGEKRTFAIHRITGVAELDTTTP